MAETIEIGAIEIAWSHWAPWEVLKLDPRREERARVPDAPGVYEAVEANMGASLTIGRGTTYG
jgi:hypothetical protein